LTILLIETTPQLDWSDLIATLKQSRNQNDPFLTTKTSQRIDEHAPLFSPPSPTFSLSFLFLFIFSLLRYNLFSFLPPLNFSIPKTMILLSRRRISQGLICIKYLPIIRKRERKWVWEEERHLPRRNEQQYLHWARQREQASRLGMR
jgi:hypothetical protein